MSEKWNGFDLVEFEFEGRRAIVVLPETGTAVGKLVLKTEYWGAFPDIELRLAAKGYHLAYLENRTRFATKDDCDAKARFVRFLAEKYALDGKCVPVGMSCGGAHAVRFAGFYPELTSCVYIDAPVLNYCSFPGRIGGIYNEKVWENEFVKAYPGIKRYQLISFGEHPMNMADVLARERIPVIMVYGLEDSTVIYEENGKLFEEAFEGTGLLKTVAVPHRGHHPHGMIGDNSEIVAFIIEHS